MSSTFSLKLIGKNNKIVDRRSVKLAAGKFIGPVIVKAQADVMYHLSAENGGQALDKVTTKKIGNDLHIVFLDGNIKSPDLIIENYFLFNSSVSLATSNLAGEFVEFAPSGAFPSDITGTTEHEGATALTAAGVVTPWYSDPLAQLAIIGGALAIVSTSKGSGGDSSSNAAPVASTIALYAKSTIGAAVPKAIDYSNAGVSGVTNSNVDAINSAVLRNGVTTTVAFQSIVTAYNKVIALANDTNADITTSQQPTRADLQKLGVNLRSANDSDTELALLLKVIGTRNAVAGDVDSVAKLDALALSVDKLAITASGNTPPAGALAASDFATFGVYDSTSVTPKTVLSSIQAGALADAIKSKSAGSETTISLDAIQTVNTAYLKILASANGTKLDTTDTTKATYDLAKAPVVSDYKTIGIETSHKAFTASDSQSAAAFALFNEVVDGQQASAVDTISELNGIDAIVDKVMNVAKAATPADASNIGLKVLDLISLGLTGVNADNLPNFVKALQATASTTGAAVDTLKELQALVDQSVVMAYADTSPNNVPAPTTAHVSPTLSSYTNIGVPTTKTGTAYAIRDVSAINSAVDALADSAKVSSLAGVQTIVNSYDKILSLADGTAAQSTPAVGSAFTLTVDTTPTLLDYQNIGALNYDPSGVIIQHGATNTTVSSLLSTTVSTKAGALNLLNDVIDVQSNQAVNSISEINALAINVDKIMALATGNTPVSIFKATDLSGLGGGISVVSDAILTQFQKDIKAIDASNVDSLKEIKSYVAWATAQQYAEYDGGTMPVFSDLVSSSATPYPTLSNWNANASALTKAVANAITYQTEQSLTQDKLLNISVSYKSILDEISDINATHTDPTATDFTNIGLNTTHLFNDHTAVGTNALTLLDDVVKRVDKTSDSIQNVKNINDWATTIDNIMKLAQIDGTQNYTAQTVPSTLQTVDLTALGLSVNNGGYNYLTANAQNKLSSLIASSANDGSAVNSLSNLQLLINQSMQVI